MERQDVVRWLESHPESVHANPRSLVDRCERELRGRVAEGAWRHAKEIAERHLHHWQGSFGLPASDDFVAREVCHELARDLRHHEPQPTAEVRTVTEAVHGALDPPALEMLREWLGELQAFETFQWHGETFSIPPGATRVLENAHCANQAFAIGKHFGMQCHVEMTEELVRAWIRGGADEVQAAAASPAVQKPEDMQRDLEPRLQRLHDVADRIYDKWTETLSRGS